MKDVKNAKNLPEELVLPLASGEPHWYWLGGRPALDLVNTLRERWRRHHHGDTIDKLPVLFIGPAFHEAAKQLD